MRLRTAVLAIPAASALFMLGLAAPALADDSVDVRLDALNDSGASGTATLTIESNGDLAVSIDAKGLVPNAPHAQHIHGATDGTDFMCPTDAADKDGDGIVSTTEGLPSYGDIFISLTTKGDTSKNSGLAVDRMPTADGDGNLEYSRTIPASELPEGTADHLRDLHVVQHGIDPNDNGKYDGDKKSDLDPKLPAEATDPASCGMVTGAGMSDKPSQGVETGAGGTSGIEGMSWFALGGFLLASAGGTVLVSRRRQAVTTVKTD
ncbi:LPXTG cell wall anchor domain-containing protein [Flindersiella endophytica]